MAKEDGQQPPSSGVEKDYNDLSSLAERLGLEDQQREKFVNSSMKRLGYTPRMSWDAPENNDGGDNEDDGDFFSGGGGKKREQRPVGGGGQQQSGGGGGNGWQYGD